MNRNEKSRVYCNGKLAVAQFVCECNSKVAICVRCIQNKVATHTLCNSKIILKHFGLHCAVDKKRQTVPLSFQIVTAGMPGFTRCFAKYSSGKLVIVKPCTFTFDLTIFLSKRAEKKKEKVLKVCLQTLDCLTCYWRNARFHYTFCKIQLRTTNYL